MAQIKDMTFNVRRKQNSDENECILDYTIEFFPIEVSLNIPFWEVAAVIEVDGGLDRWHKYSVGGGFWWEAVDGNDEFIKFLHYQDISPNGNNEFRRHIVADLPDDWPGNEFEPGSEQIRPIVYVNPHISSHLLVGEQVNFNLSDPWWEPGPEDGGGR